MTTTMEKILGDALRDNDVAVGRATVEQVALDLQKAFQAHLDNPLSLPCPVCDQSSMRPCKRTYGDRKGEVMLDDFHGLRNPGVDKIGKILRGEI